MEVPGPIGANAKGHDREAGELGRGHCSPLEHLPRPLRAVWGEGQIVPAPGRSKDALQTLHSSSGAGASGRAEAVLMNDTGDVLAVRVFAYQHHDPFVSMVMDKGQELTVPECKDDGLSLAAKL
jgi:hypothetical protein